MFDAGVYLRRIGCGGEKSINIQSLRALHKNHLMAIPYDIAGQSHTGAVNLVDLDEDELFEASIVDGRGGNCFQLSRLFFRLLGELGYDVSLMAAGTAEGLLNFGTDVEHMFSRVALDGDEWLVDVGYPGPSFLEPLLVCDQVQTQYSCQYRLVGLAGSDDGRIALQRRSRVSRWAVVYTFRLKARQFSEWRDLESRIRSNPPERDQAHANAQGVLCGRSFDNGQVVLKGRRHLTVRDGREQARTIVDDNEHKALVSGILSGILSGEPGR